MKRTIHPGNQNLLFIACLNFALLLLFAGNYGLFRDEFYYIACSKRLAWGYVDQPPFSIALLALSRFLFGDSLIAIRLFAYLAGSGTVFLAGVITREFGGTMRAQALAAFSTMFAGTVLVLSGFYSMNPIDVFFSVLFFWVLIRLIRGGNVSLWYALGAIGGIGLLNKASFVFIAAALIAGMLLTPERKYFLRKEFWLSMLLALVIFSPHLLWQYQQGFPTLEFMKNAAEYKNKAMGFAEFFFNVALNINPFNLPLLAAALWFFFRDREGRKFALGGIVFILLYAFFWLNHGKPYYLSILFPLMLAGGAAGIEKVFAKYTLRKTAIAGLALLCAGYLFSLPLSLPVLPVEKFIAFSQMLGFVPESGERSRLGVLPQYYADRFGWQELTAETAKAFKSLSEEEKKQALIFTQNYGEAGALEYFGKHLQLPPVVSGHNNYWLWGYPQDRSGDVMIIVGGKAEDHAHAYREVTRVGRHFHPYGMPYENRDIFVCKGLKVPLSELWKHTKSYG